MEDTQLGHSYGKRADTTLVGAFGDMNEFFRYALALICSTPLYQIVSLLQIKMKSFQSPKLFLNSLDSPTQNI